MKNASKAQGGIETLILITGTKQLLTIFAFFLLIGMALSLEGDYSTGTRETDKTIQTAQTNAYNTGTKLANTDTAKQTNRDYSTIPKPEDYVSVPREFVSNDYTQGERVFVPNDYSTGTTHSQGDYVTVPREKITQTEYSSGDYSIVPRALIPENYTQGERVFVPNDSNFGDYLTGQKPGKDFLVIPKKTIQPINASEATLIVKEKKLFVKTEQGEKEIKVSPTEAIKKIKTNIDITSVKLEIENNKPIYRIKGDENSRLFAIIPIKVPVETKIDANTNTIQSREMPWWSALAIPEKERCINECQEGEATCITVNTRQICGNFDSDSCMEWREETCATNNACIKGQCIYNQEMATYKCEETSLVGDINNDGTIGLNDVIAIAALWKIGGNEFITETTGNCCADITKDGMFDFSDVEKISNDWRSGASLDYGTCDCPLGWTSNNGICQPEIVNVVASSNLSNYTQKRITFMQQRLYENFDTHPQLLEKVMELTADKNSDLQKVQAIANWVKRSKSFDVNCGTESSLGCDSPANNGASFEEIWDSEKGVCADAAVLTVAMLRTAGIPSMLHFISLAHVNTLFFANGNWQATDSTFCQNPEDCSDAGIYTKEESYSGLQPGLFVVFDTIGYFNVNGKYCAETQPELCLSRPFIINGVIDKNQETYSNSMDIIIPAFSRSLKIGTKPNISLFDCQLKFHGVASRDGYIVDNNLVINLIARLLFPAVEDTPQGKGYVRTRQIKYRATDASEDTINQYNYSCYKRDISDQGEIIQEIASYSFFLEDEPAIITPDLLEKNETASQEDFDIIIQELEDITQGISPEP